MSFSKAQGRILYYMGLAVNVSMIGQGFTGNNPSVGCIVVKNNEIIGKGVTGMNGSPHAEEVALKAAGEKARGSELYTTLEPCAHHGRTAPCVDLIIDSGVKKVFIGIKDPDERVNCKGIEKLQESGINVVKDVLRRECFLSNIGYFYRQVLGRPFVILKIATTLDGKIASYSGKSEWITGPGMRRVGHKLRAMTSAIMVGYSTISNDDPQLNCRLTGIKKDSVKVVLDTMGKISSPDLKIFRDGITWSFGKKNTFKHRNFFSFESKITEEGRVDLEDVLTQLGGMGINSVLVECGNKLFTSFLQEQLFDQVVWFRANTIGGADALNCCGALSFSHPSEFIKLKKTHEIRCHGETIDFFSCEPSLRLEKALKSI